MLHLGDVPANSTIYIPFASYNSSGASVTLTGLATGDILIYKNGSVTQRTSTNGFTLLDTDGIDFDGVTGLHGFSVDLSDNSDSGFYSVGGFYWVVVSTVTIDSQTVTLIAATFRIVAAEGVTGYPNVTLGNVAHGGAAASFAFGAGGTISNASGTALALTSSGSNGHGLSATGNGTGSGINGQGGATGVGILGAGGATSGSGIRGNGTSEAHGIEGRGNGGGSGMFVQGGNDSAHGLYVLGGTGGNGLNAVAGSGGLDIDGAVNEFTAAGLAQFFTTDSGSDYASAVAGSVVKETADNAGGSALTVEAIADEVETRTIAGVTTVGTVNALAANSVSASALATDAVTEIVNGLLAGVIEGTLTVQQATKLIVAAAAGKLSGAATSTVTIRDTTDSKNRITATVDADGNRSAVSYDVS